MIKLFRKKESKIPTPEEMAREAQKTFEAGAASLRDLIAPSSFEVTAGYLRLGNKLVRTFFAYSYPRYLYTNWLSPVINLDFMMDIAVYVYPINSRTVLENLRKRVSQMEASMMISQEKGKVRDPALETALKDAESLRDRIQRGEERFFRFGLYFTLYADTTEDLDLKTKQLETILGGSLVYTKMASLQMEQGFSSTLPLLSDQLSIEQGMNTGAISATFPFISANLTSNKGILYGVNLNNDSLVIYDRFDLENANMVVFAKSGAGKSYAVKLESLRSLMFGTEIIIIDPEYEYKTLCDAVGGAFIDVSLKSDEIINPFDLPRILDQEEAEGVLMSNIIMLHGLLRIMLGGLTPQEDSILDRALIESYAKKGITSDPLTHMDIDESRVPTMTDLYEILKISPGGEDMAERLSKFVEGSYAGLFTGMTNINLNNKFLVFSIRDLEDELRPIAMYMILNNIWNKVKSDKKKRLLIMEEAWQMLKYEDSAQFLFSIAKRARKYYLGLTTISQDVEDFLTSRYGRAVVSNSSLQLLLKQSPASVDLVAKTFHLTEEEKLRLTQFNVGEGLFFAGFNHVLMQVLPSPTEDQLITTNPEELLAMGKL